MAKRSIKKNFILNSAYQVLLIITPFITAPYLSRVLGPEQIGVFSYTQSIAYYFYMFAILGMTTYGVRLIALCGADRKKRSKEFWSAYFSQLIIGVFVVIVYLFYIYFYVKDDYEVQLIWLFYIASAIFDVTWLLFGIEEFKIPTIRSFLTKLTSVIIIFMFVKDENDLWIYVISIAGSYFLNAILIWPFVKDYVDFYKPSISEISRHVRPNLGLFLPVISVSVYTKLDRIMLGYMAGMADVGYFQYAEQISRLPLSVITALGTVMMPHMAKHLAANRRKEALDLLKNSIWFMLVCAFAFAFGICAVANEFVPIFFGEEYIPCIRLMIILSIIIPIICATNVVGKQYLLPMSRDREFSLSLIAGAAINIVLNLMLIPKIGAEGTAIGTVAAEFTILIVQVISVRRELPLKEYFYNAIPFAMIGFVMFIMTRLFTMYLAARWGLCVKLLLAEILFGSGTYAIMSYLYCRVTHNVIFYNLLISRSVDNANKIKL